MAEAVNVHEEEEKELLRANHVSRKLTCLIICQQRGIINLRAIDAGWAGEGGRAEEGSRAEEGGRAEEARFQSKNDN